LFLERWQGEVEQISLMKPKAQGPHDEGFLEYLEDIIGTNKYVEKIDELNKQWVIYAFVLFLLDVSGSWFVGCY